MKVSISKPESKLFQVSQAPVGKLYASLIPWLSVNQTRRVLYINILVTEIVHNNTIKL